MLWMAWQLARSSKLGEAGRAHLTITFWQGVALQFVNVKAWLAALVISATWIAVDGEFGVRLAQVLPLMLAYGFASNFAMPWPARCCGAGWRRGGACCGSTARWRACSPPRRSGCSARETSWVNLPDPKRA